MAKKLIYFYFGNKCLAGKTKWDMSTAKFIHCDQMTALEQLCDDKNNKNIFLIFFLETNDFQEKPNGNMSTAKFIYCDQMTVLEQL